MLASGSQECLRSASMDMTDMMASGVMDESQQRPRLVIHQIVMENFKSYAGRQVIGPFHKVQCFLSKRMNLYDFVVIYVDCWS